MRENYGTHGMDAITDYILVNVLGVSGEDDYVSDDQGSGAALVGKRILRWDDRGFADTTSYKTTQEATEAFSELQGYYLPETVTEIIGPRDYQRHYRNGDFKYLESPYWNVDDTYTHPHFKGIGLRIYGPAIRASFTYPDDVDYEIADGNVMVHMVGDDGLHMVDVESLVKIEDVCSCGQIGCGWDN